MRHESGDSISKIDDAFVTAVHRNPEPTTLINREGHTANVVANYRQTGRQCLHEHTGGTFLKTGGHKDVLLVQFLTDLMERDLTHPSRHFLQLKLLAKR